MRQNVPKCLLLRPSSLPFRHPLTNQTNPPPSLARLASSQPGFTAAAAGRDWHQRARDTRTPGAGGKRTRRTACRQPRQDNRRFRGWQQKWFTQLSATKSTGRLWWSCRYLGWVNLRFGMFHHLAQLYSQFSQVPVCPSRTVSAYSGITQPRCATTRITLYRKDVKALWQLTVHNF